MVAKTTTGHRVPWIAKRDPYKHDGKRPMVLLLLRASQGIRDGKCMVLDRDRPLDPEPMKPREGQILVLAAMFEKAVAGLPVKVLVAKYRRNGVSTVVQWVFHTAIRITKNRNAVTVAHTDEASEKVFQLAKIMDDPENAKGENPDWKIERPEMRTLYECLSGAGKFVGSGSTYNYVHVSELPKMDNTTGQDQRFLLSMLNAVASMSTESIVVIEASGQGPEGTFPDRCRAAAKGKGGYAMVFLSWLEDPALRLDEDLLADDFDPPLAGYEITLRESYGATDGQIAWRRLKMSEDFSSISFKDNPPELLWDFPVTMEECFAHREGRIYAMVTREKHEGVVELKQLSFKAFRVRFIDWGFSKEHAFVCLFVMVDPSKPPQLMISPKCPKLWMEVEKYHRHIKTGKPIEVDDHALDALRIGIVTLRVESFVHVYQELYITDFGSKMTPQWIAREIHRLSGWKHPSGDPDHADVSDFQPPTKRHLFEMGVADRSRPGDISQYIDWKIPLQPSRPIAKDKKRFGEVEDGISVLQRIMGGNIFFRGRSRDTQGDTLRCAVKKITDHGRQKILSVDEARALEQERKRLGKRSQETIPLSAPINLYGQGRAN